MSDKKVEQVLKLLAQAEGTDNEAEALAYIERAQHVATVNAIDLALLEARQKNKVTREEITVKRVQVGEPKREHKNRFYVDLFLEIAYANDLECTIAWDRATCNAFGYPSDIGVAEILFTSLATQMVGLAAESLRKGEHRERGVHGKTWRNNFYEGYCAKIGERLRRARRDALAEQKARDEEIADRLSNALLKDADDAAVPQAEPEVTGALVMVAKSAAVKEYYDRTNGAKGVYRSYGAGTKNYGAQRAGAAAAERARLTSQAAVADGGRKALA